MDHRRTFWLCVMNLSCQLTFGGSIIDSLLLMVMGESVKVEAWYDMNGATGAKKLMSLKYVVQQ